MTEQKLSNFISTANGLQIIIETKNKFIKMQRFDIASELMGVQKKVQLELIEMLKRDIPTIEDNDKGNGTNFSIQQAIDLLLNNKYSVSKDGLYKTKPFFGKIDGYINETENGTTHYNIHVKEDLSIKYSVSNKDWLSEITIIVNEHGTPFIEKNIQIKA